MSWLMLLVQRKITSDRLDLLIAQLVCFAAGPVLLYFGVVAAERHATTAGELAIGVMAAVILCLLVIIIGLLMPLASPAWRHQPRR